MKNKSKPILYTDGSCLTTRDGAGGWAFMLCINGKEISGSEGVKNTTNNRMEIQAVVEGLDFYFRFCDNREVDIGPIKIVTDSMYVINGSTQWVRKWKRYGWRTSNGNEVANRDKWEELYDLLEYVSVEWEWVKSHSGNVFNDTVDELARIQSASIAGIVL